MRLLRTSLVPFVALGAFLLSGCNGGGGDGGGLGGEGGAPPGCRVDADCDDSFYCNGIEVCDQGLCRQGTKVACDDGIDCTVDRCDEGTRSCASTAKDADGDGHGVAGCLDAENKPLGDDCNDDDALVFPGNEEVCDPENRDEDCNPATIGERDTDGDTYFDAACCNKQKNGKLECGDDCDDHRANVSPAAVEACDGFDNDCDGKVDDGVSIDMYPDLDHDGHGDTDVDAVKSCPGAVGFALVANDCDDADPEVFVGQFEICDGKDNNCDADRLVDEVQEQAPWYIDLDKDGYGDPLTSPVFSCSRPSGRVLSHNDCDDANKKVNPNATEICDALDNDCNGLADFRVGAVANNFEDNDGDGVADADCGGGDCDDTNPYTAAGAPEFCDNIDNDCDDAIDEDVVTNIWYVDNDGDGWGVGFGTAIASCVPLSGLANKYGDCNDGNASALPGGVEFCDGIDQDCDGIVDDGATAYCDLENAISRCYRGACRVYTCTAGFKDADGDPSNGCEAPVTHAENLIGGTFCTTNGDCSDGKYCTGTESCFEGSCYRGNPVHCEIGDGTIQGNVTINSGVDLKLLEGIVTITGNLTISNTELVNLVGLESLRVIGGDLYIYSNGSLLKLSGSALSGLEVIGGKLTVSTNDSLETIYLPSLVSLGSLSVSDYYEGGGSPLKKIDLPSLVQVEGEINIHPSSPVFESISMPKLVRADRLDIQYDASEWGSDKFAKLDFGSLTTVDRWIDVHAPIVASAGTFSMDALEVVASTINGETGLPFNNGAVTLCVGPIAQPCATFDALVASGYTGTIEDCGVCPKPATVAAGEHHACAIASGGDVMCWGLNESGEVGSSALASNTSPLGLGLAKVDEVAAGKNHSCALLGDGSVKCWGDNSAGQLGVDNQATPSSQTPVSIPGLSGVKSIRSGGDRNCALLDAGTLVCWGGSFGSPGTIPSLTSVSDFSVGATHACVVRGSGDLLCWGDNSVGQLGDGTSTARTMPTKTLATLEPATYVTNAWRVAVGSDNTCFVLLSGEMRCSGSTVGGKSGIPFGLECEGNCSYVPQPTQKSFGASRLGAGNSHTCALVQSSVQCFGTSSVGQLGDGWTDGGGVVHVYEPSAGAKVRELATGAYFNCIRTSEGGVYCFGDNGSNQLGYDLSVTPSPPLDQPYFNQVLLPILVMQPEL